VNESGWEQVDFVAKPINNDELQVDKTERMEVGDLGWLYRTIVKIEHMQRDAHGADLGHEVRSVSVALCYVPKR
jgi:hypothetical protein